MSVHPHPTTEESGSIWKILNVILALILCGFTLFWAVILLVGTKAETSGWNEVEENVVEAPLAATAAEVPAAPAPDAPVAGTAPAADAAPATAPTATTPASAPAEITIKVDVANPMAFDVKEFTVKAAQAVKLTFNNIHPSVPQMHNLVIGVPGSKDKLLGLAMQMATSPDGMAKGYVPDSPDILFFTKLLQPNQSDTIEFTAPAVGEYPYICTFPGHGTIMNGVMRVE
jgi:azurin